MDRNQAIGLALIAGILIVYSLVFRPPIEETTPLTDSTNVETPVEIESTTIKEPQETVSTDTAVASEQYGVFAPMLSGSSELITIETDLVKYTFNSKGGTIESVELKEYKSYNGDPLLLMTALNNQQDWILQTVKGNINISDLYFEVDGGNRTLSGEETTSLKFRSVAADGGSIEYNYELSGNSYEVGFNAKINGLNTSILGEDLTLKWSKAMSRFEKNLEDARNKTTIISTKLNQKKIKTKDIKQKKKENS